MAFANVPNEVFAFDLSITPLPPADNLGICLQFPDFMCILEMCWNTLACNLCTARLRVTLAGPLTRRRRQAGVGDLCRGYMAMCFIQLCNFWNSRHLSHMLNRWYGHKA